jgi:hypothetical protein
MRSTNVAKAWRLSLTCATTLLLVFPAQAQQPAGRSPFSGAWILNAAESEAHRDGRGGNSPPLGTGGSREMKTTQALVQELLASHARFMMTIDDGVVSFVLRDGRTRRFGTRGQREKHEFESGSVDTITRWVRDTLVREFAAPDGSTLIETYSFVPEVRQLRVELRVVNWRLPATVTITRIYDDVLDR